MIVNKSAPPLRTYVVKDGRRFRLCLCERTPRGPRRRNLVTLGTHKDCCTVPGAMNYWRTFYAAAMANCKTEAENYPYTYKSRRTWQRASARCYRARARLDAINLYA
jgi:hypothetical protein